MFLFEMSFVQKKNASDVCRQSNFKMRWHLSHFWNESNKITTANRQWASGNGHRAHEKEKVKNGHKLTTKWKQCFLQNRENPFENFHLVYSFFCNFFRLWFFVDSLFYPRTLRCFCLFLFIYLRLSRWHINWKRTKDFSFF